MSFELIPAVRARTARCARSNVANGRLFVPGQESRPPGETNSSTAPTDCAGAASTRAPNTPATATRINNEALIAVMPRSIGAPPAMHIGQENVFGFYLRRVCALPKTEADAQRADESGNPVLT